MAAITSAVIGGLSAGASLVQYAQQQKLSKQASKAREQALNRLKAIQEQNPFAAVQTPTLGSKMAMEQISQQGADTLSALQGAGAEGVIGGVTALNQGLRGAELDVAANLDQMRYQRDMTQAEAQAGINARAAERDFKIGTAEANAAAEQQADATLAGNQALGNAFSALGTAAGALGAVEKFDYTDIEKLNDIQKKEFNALTSDADRMTYLAKLYPNKFKYRSGRQATPQQAATESTSAQSLEDSIQSFLNKPIRR